MEDKKPSALRRMILLFICTLGFFSAIAEEIEIEAQSTLETYIVHVSLPSDHVSTSSDGLERFYKSFLPKTTESLNQRTRIVHQYRNVVTGFAARLTPEEVKEIEKREGFVSARPQKVFALHTTHSPSFLGLQQNLGFWNGSNYGEGVIIGVLDTGITPGHPSFNDEGIPPPPSKWKGKCELNGTTCNNKLIGARNFVDTTTPPLDEEGHGTHTSSTAAGNFVKDANVFGQAKGTAVGIAPRAHVAMYKVCEEFCDESAILAAMDAAVEDGVDVLSLSLGGGSSPFYADGIATGAFGAIQKGVFVSCSAGNEGPYNASLSNEAPWILTVGASTIDRNIRATAVLGNKEEFNGETLFQPADFPSTLLPLVYPGLNDEEAALCAPGSLMNNTNVKGKVVVCVRGGNIARIDKGKEVKNAGGAAMILLNAEADGYSTLADAHVLPAAHLSYAAGQKIIAYLNSTSTPTATIVFKGTIIGVKDAPAVTSFSSRGPSLESPGILKPDIIGPGVSILAAWPVSVENNTDAKSTFNIISGTSMSCPHLSGIAALLKSSHPDWSPAAIKSAIMTSAYTMNLNGDHIIDERLLPANVFAVGAGHVNPSGANAPGLIYDIQPVDYIPYLCGLGYTESEVAQIVQHTVNCSQVPKIPEAQLNYPSFSVKLGSTSQTYTRTVTNVGDAQSTYSFQIFGLPWVEISVKPTTLVFTGVKQQQTYQVSFIRRANAPSSIFVEGSIAWSSNKYFVRSPISVEFE